MDGFLLPNFTTQCRKVPRKDSGQEGNRRKDSVKNPLDIR